jgi:hypothetical protein
VTNTLAYFTAGSVTKINEVSLGLIIITNTPAYFAVGSVVSKVSLG